MKLSFKYVPKLDRNQKEIIEELCYHTTKIYNIVNYDMQKNGYRKFEKNYYIYKENYHTEFLHSHTYQYCLKVLCDNYKSYFGLLKKYEKTDKKVNKPRYKHVDKNKNEIMFSNYGIRLKGNILMLSLSKKMQEKYMVKSLDFVISDKLQSHINVGKIKQIKIKYNKRIDKWEFIVISETRDITCMTERFENVMGIDIGLSNLAACTNLENEDSLLINGKPLKSFNKYINNKISKLQRIEMKKTGSKYYKNTKQINRLQEYRKNYIKTYMQKGVKNILKYVLSNEVKTVIIGDITNIKQGMNYNKNFVQIPVQEFVNMIENKLKMFGVEVIKINESYTSGCSSIDLEEINKENYKKSRRIKRGLFRTNEGQIINADINGSLNILRKYLKDKSIPKLIKEAMDKGRTRTPVKPLIA